MILKNSKEYEEGKREIDSKKHLVKELKETISLDEVNRLVANGWIVLETVQNCNKYADIKFLLGKIERTAQEVPVQEQLVITIKGNYLDKFTFQQVKKKLNQLINQVEPLEIKLKFIEKMVKEICENRLIGFESRQEDAQLIAKVIKTLAGEENLPISYAQAILEDAKKILPMIVTL